MVPGSRAAHALLLGKDNRTGGQGQGTDASRVEAPSEELKDPNRAAQPLVG